MLWPNTMGVQFGMTLYGLGEWHHPDTSRMYVNLQTSPNTDQFEIWWAEPFVIFVFCSIQAQNPEVAISVFPPLEGLQRILGTWKIFVFVLPLQSQQLSVSHHHLLHLYSCMADGIEDKKVLSRSSSRLEFGAWSLCEKRNQGWWG